MPVIVSSGLRFFSFGQARVREVERELARAKSEFERTLKSERLERVSSMLELILF